MFNLNDKDICWLLIESGKNESSIQENQSAKERLCSVLYSKDFTISPIKKCLDNILDDSFLAIIPSIDNDSIRNEVLHILEFLDIENSIIKYSQQIDPIVIHKNGQEKPLKINLYPNSLENGYYIFEGLTFNFEQKQRYFLPKNKNHLKNGMIVEYFNDNIWKSKQISDLDQEFDKMFSLLIKYNKLRIPMN